MAMRGDGAEETNVAVGRKAAAAEVASAEVEEQQEATTAFARA